MRLEKAFLILLFDKGRSPFCEIFPFCPTDVVPPMDEGPYKTFDYIPYPPLLFELAVLAKLSIEEPGGGRREATSLFVFKRKLCGGT